jgi:hypothetical protein
MPDLLTLTPPPTLPKRPPRQVYHNATLASASDALRGFPEFASNLWIESKEFGHTRLKLWGTQDYAIQEIGRGIEDGIRTFYLDKGRQDGLTTGILALDLYWMIKFPGMQADLISDTDDNRNVFKDTLDTMHAGLPKAWSCPKKAHNRAFFSFANRSRLMYQVAGTRKADERKASPIGQSRGLNYIHATECGSWADEEQLERLLASLADIHPHRLYVFESTARGYNLWYDMWKDAQHAVSIRPIFVGFWRNENKRLSPDSAAFKVYWDGRLTGDERTRVKAIKKLYGVEVLPECIAWWRWKHAEHIKDEATMHQEYPWLPEDSFQATGSQFISGGKIAQMHQGLEKSPAGETYAYTFGTTFDTTELHQTNPGRGGLRVWEPHWPGATYVLGADPAYGSSPDSDRYAATLWRVEGGKLVEVAEYVTVLGTAYQFAWVLMHLCGSYGGDVLLVLELSGPGQGVWDEIQRMSYYGWGVSAGNSDLTDVFNSIRHYLYRRTDSLNPNVVYQWKMGQNKVWLMNKLRDTIERGGLVVRSKELADELAGLRQDGDSIEAHGRAKDDRAISTALAVEGWLTMLVPELGLQEPGEAPPPDTVLGQSVVNFLKELRRPKQE